MNDKGSHLASIMTGKIDWTAYCSFNLDFGLGLVPSLGMAGGRKSRQKQA
jgi:hypothetical protein